MKRFKLDQKLPWHPAIKRAGLVQYRDSILHREPEFGMRRDGAIGIMEPMYSSVERLIDVLESEGVRVRPPDSTYGCRGVVGFVHNGFFMPTMPGGNGYDETRAEPL